MPPQDDRHIASAPYAPRQDMITRFQEESSALTTIHTPTNGNTTPSSRRCHASRALLRGKPRAAPAAGCRSPNNDWLNRAGAVSLRRAKTAELTCRPRRDHQQKFATITSSPRSAKLCVTSFSGDAAITARRLGRWLPRVGNFLASATGTDKRSAADISPISSSARC